MVDLQDAWVQYLRDVSDQFSPEFWTFFCSMHEQPTVAIDAALKGVKRGFLLPRVPARLKMFATSKQHMLTRIHKNVPSFLTKVSHSLTIDLASFGLTEKLTFTFLDPVWAWLKACSTLPPEETHWIPQRRFNAHGQRVYGGGVENGKSFEEAFRSCPAGGYPMLINLHWDGTSAHGVSATPIAVGVANCNVQCADAHNCIGYMPTVETKLKGDLATEVKFYIRQKCVGAILSATLPAARTGVTCRVRGNDGNGIILTLFPRLMTMALDQPEAQLFFGQLNAQSCTECTRRKGRSAHRKARLQERSAIMTLYNIVSDPLASSSSVTLAKQRLARYGFNWKRRCVLLSPRYEPLLIQPAGSVSVFPNVGMRDYMHAVFMFFGRVIVELFQGMHLRNKIRDTVTINQRLLHISTCGCMRDEETGRSYRVQGTTFKEAGMTAADRVCLLFMLPHVLGHEARVLPQNLRNAMLQALAQAQQIIIALTRRRSYTKQELGLIFDDGYVMRSVIL